MSEARVIRGHGTAEATWRMWDGLSRLAPIALDEVLPARARLVVVAPHPDDELLACGGLIALHAARGGECLVIGVTDGEASHAGAPGWDAQWLARTRRAERTLGLHRLGADDAKVICLGLPDGAVATHAALLTIALQPLLCANDLVVTTWRLDGHPDHEACGNATAQACAQVGCILLEAPVWMWHWAAPADRRVPWERMRGVRLPAETIECRRSAVMAHATQWRPRSAQQGPVLTSAIAARLERRTEAFFIRA